MLPLFALFLCITSSPALVVTAFYGTAWPLLAWVAGALLLIIAGRDRDAHSNNRLQILGRR